MATLPDLEQATRRVWELICAEASPDTFTQNVDLANEAAIQLIVEGGFDAGDSDLIFGGEMDDVCQTLLAAAFMLQPQLATRILNLPDEDVPADEVLGMTAAEYAELVGGKRTAIQEAVQEHFESLGRES